MKFNYNYSHIQLELHRLKRLIGNSCKNQIYYLNVTKQYISKQPSGYRFPDLRTEIHEKVDIDDHIAEVESTEL